MKLWCFGDSNTYGYDPCGFFGGRYTAPWPELLAEQTGDRVINDGRNGRMIPGRECEFVRFRRDAERYGADALIVMLGANDLLNGATAGEAAARMEAFLNRCSLPRTLLIGPPPMKRGAWVPDDHLVEESQALARQYEVLADRLGIRFADAGEWDIALAFDGVHFSEEGHARFAEELAARLYDMEGNMSRIKDLQKQVHKILEKIEDGDKRLKAVSHLHGVALAAAVLAKKRGENAELATMAGLLHDLYAYKSGSYDDHARLGAEYARKLLERAALTMPEETDAICSAILHHDGKAGTDGPLDEILKDADVIDHSLSDPTKEIKPHEQARYAKLCGELGFADV